MEFSGTWSTSHGLNLLLTPLKCVRNVELKGYYLDPGFPSSSISTTFNKLDSLLLANIVVTSHAPLIDLLCGSLRLKKLRLENVKFTRATPLVLKPTGNRSMTRYLHSLELSSSTPMVKWLLTRWGAFVPSLKALQLGCIGELAQNDLASLESLFHPFKESLDELRLEFRTTYNVRSLRMSNFPCKFL